MPGTQPSPSPSVIALELDEPRQLLRQYFRGIVRSADVDAHVDQLQLAVGRVGRGFRLLTDLTELQEMDLDAVRPLTRMMDLCLASGVAQIVRVIPDPNKDIGFQLLSLTHYRGRVPIVTCTTRAEGEAALAAAP